VKYAFSHARENNKEKGVSKVPVTKLTAGVSKIKKNDFFLPKYLHISEKSSTFASDF